MKNRIIRLTPSFLVDALLGKPTKLASNLPRDIEIIDIKSDMYSNQILAVIRSDSFQDVAENQPVPELVLNYPPISGASQPTIAIKSETARQMKPLQNPTSKIEEEFSPEQRRLLSFKTENEQVLVKPTQFLKAEWDDINDIVRSLGGKWVKGDIISYWVIPT